jgi:RNA 2',3'-cyclic 3'-phosphodiesterase
VAVELDAATRAAVARATDELRGRAGALSVSWVAPDNLHVTVKFLGGIDPTRVPALVTALLGAAAAVAPFTIEVAGLGAFPSATRPRVVWAGISRGAETLTVLAARIDDALAGRGIPRETRAFSPHVTIGRVRESRRAPELAQALGDARPFGHVRVDTITLMRSELSPRGARYTPLATVPLGA